MESGPSKTRSTGVEARLLGLAAIAAAMDINWSDERLLRSFVDCVLITLGDHSLVRLTGDDRSPGPEATTHADAVGTVLRSKIGSGAAGGVVSYSEPSGEWLAGYGLRQYAVFPVTSNNRTMGLLVITRADERSCFDDADRAFGAAIAAFLGSVVVARRMLAYTTTAVDELRAQAEVVDQISDALITCDGDLRVLSWNVAAERTYGYAQSEAIGCDLSALLSTRYLTPDGVPVTFDEVFAAVHETGRWDGELHERHANGTSLVLVSSISATTGRNDLVLVNRDVTAQRREEHLALHDALTGLPNRRMLGTKLNEAFVRACRSKRSMAVLFIDLDGFKPINDRYGHAAGDTVLTITAQRLVDAVRRTDTVGRLGGDEFLVILEDVGTDDNIRAVADRIVEWVGSAIDVEGGTVVVHPSIGVAAVHDPDADVHRPDQLLAAADQAMYEAKQGDGQPVFASSPAES